ncbi:hypothetical protein [Chamaesiphon sp.]
MIPIRNNIQYHQDREIFCAANDLNLSDSDLKEFTAYQTKDRH